MSVNEIWEAFEKSGSDEFRNQLIMNYLPLVRKVVNSLLKGIGAYNIKEDYYSIGIIGLIDAIGKYDSSKKSSFESYASIRIRGTIKDHQRKEDVVSRTLRQKQRKIQEAEDKLYLMKGEQPTVDEIANECNFAVNEVIKTLDEITRASVVSFEQKINNGFFVENPSNDDYDPQYQIEKKELSTALTQAIETLNEREQLIVSLYYRDELTLKEMGHILKVSESRVSQILKKTLEKLKKELNVFLV